MENIYLESKWNQLKGSVREKWGKLTDDDVEIIKGNIEQLVGKLQEKYSKAKPDAEKEINDWIAEMKSKIKETS